MDLGGVMLGEIIQTEKDIPHDLTYMGNLKIIIKTKKPRSQIQRTDWWWLPKMAGVGANG